jgi:hypothetical protein
MQDENETMRSGSRNRMASSSHRAALQASSASATVERGANALEERRWREGLLEQVGPWNRAAWLQPVVGVP